MLESDMYLEKSKLSCTVKTFSGWKPASTRCKLIRLRTVRPAPINKRNETATCATISALRALPRDEQHGAGGAQEEQHRWLGVACELRLHRRHFHFCDGILGVIVRILALHGCRDRREIGFRLSGLDARLHSTEEAQHATLAAGHHLRVRAKRARGRSHIDVVFGWIWRVWPQS